MKSPRLDQLLRFQFGALAGLVIGAAAMEPIARFGDGMKLAVKDQRFAAWLADYSAACLIERDLQELCRRWEALQE